MMLCEKCQKRPATVYMTKILNGEKIEANLCEVCALEHQNINFGFDPKFLLQNIFAGFFNNSHPDGELVKVNTAQPIQCDNCGFTEKDFSRLGRLGCTKCYDVFEPKLDPLLKRVHGHDRHTGKIPSRTGGTLVLKKQIDDLRQQLSQAIAKEEFEEAARLRDDIHKLEERLS